MSSAEGRILPGLGTLTIFLLFLPFLFVGLCLLMIIWSALKNWGRPALTGDADSQPIVSSGDPGECPICMDPIAFGVETNCRHRFCAQCFCLHWRRTLYGRQITCPICRGHVRFLKKHFSPAEMEQTDVRRTLEGDIDLFNRWHSGRPVPILRRLRDLPIMFTDALRFVFSGDGTPFLIHSRLVLLGLCVVLYVLSPFDVIPEGVAGLFGLLDDLVVLLIFGIHAFAVYRSGLARFVQRPAQPQQPTR